MIPIPAIIGLVAAVAPPLIDYLAGPRAGSVAEKVATAAQEVFNTTDATAIEKAIAQDPQLAATFRTRMAEIAAAESQAERDENKARWEAIASDLANARAHTLALADKRSILVWGAPVVSVIITTGFFVILWVLITRPIDLDDTQRDILLIMIGVLGGAFSSVVAYWMGSSMGSANKDDKMERITSRALSTASSARLSETERLNQRELDRARRGE